MLSVKQGGRCSNRWSQGLTSHPWAYSCYRADSSLTAVYDLGYGTFDISILEMQQGVFKSEVDQWQYISVVKIPMSTTSWANSNLVFRCHPERPRPGQAPSTPLPWAQCPSHRVHRPQKPRSPMYTRCEPLTPHRPHLPHLGKKRLWTPRSTSLVHWSLFVYFNYSWVNLPQLPPSGLGGT